MGPLVVWGPLGGAVTPQPQIGLRPLRGACTAGRGGRERQALAGGPHLPKSSEVRMGNVGIHPMLGLFGKWIHQQHLHFLGGNGNGNMINIQRIFWQTAFGTVIFLQMGMTPADHFVLSWEPHGGRR